MAFYTEESKEWLMESYKLHSSAIKSSFLTSEERRETLLKGLEFICEDPFHRQIFHAAALYFDIFCSRRKVENPFLYMMASIVLADKFQNDHPFTYPFKHYLYKCTFDELKAAELDVLQELDWSLHRATLYTVADVQGKSSIEMSNLFCLIDTVIIDCASTVFQENNYEDLISILLKSEIVRDDEQVYEELHNILSEDPEGVYSDRPEVVQLPYYVHPLH